MKTNSGLSQKNWWKGFFSDKYWINPNIKVSSNRVCAGDPVHGYVNSDDQIEINRDYLRENYKVNPDEYKLFKVDGWSMFPEGIKEGDVLLCKPVRSDWAAQLPKGYFAVIRVDSEYYTSRGRSAFYAYKLRKTIEKFPLDMDVEAIIKYLTEREDSILLKSNQKKLRKKYKESFDYYRDRLENKQGNQGDTDMMLSKTYHDGVLNYSFHPSRLIDYAVCYVYRLDGPEPLLLPKMPA